MSTVTPATLPARPSKPPPAGPAPPAPASNGAAPKPHPHPALGTATPPAAVANGAPTQKGAPGKKGAAKADTPVDPQAMYESLKSKIAALEEELNHADEEELKFAEEAQKSVRGMEDNAVHAKYVELFAEMKRVERDHAKEKQKLVKDKDTAKSQLTKVNQTKAKLENLARDLTKDNKKLREEKQHLLQDVAKGLDEIKQLSAEITKGKDKARQAEARTRDQPDIVVKVVCKYRAELFFKISRKTKLSRLFAAWTERMENNTLAALRKAGAGAGSTAAGAPQVNGTAAPPPPAPTPSPPPAPQSAKGSDAASTHSNGSAHSGSTAVNGAPPPPPMAFLYTHQGRSLYPEMTIEDAGIDDTDEILAVELMDLTGPLPDDAEELVEARRPKLKKNWAENPREAKRAMEEIFDGVAKERLKLVLRQYELRERHFECFIRSKELELLLAKYRESEQRQLVEFERSRIDKLEEDNQQVRKELEDVHNGQTLLIEKLIQCCKEPNAERTQRLFTSLREELEKRGTKLVDGVVGG